MSRKIVAAAVLLALAVSAGLSLIGGASCLDAPLAGAVPLGNLLAAVGLCAMAGAAVVISTRGTGLRAAALAALAGAMLWLPVDVPPLLSSATIWSPIPNEKEIGREEALFRGTDHRLPA